MPALAASPEITSVDRLSVTIFFAVVAHLIVILGVTFVHEDYPDRRVESLDVVLVPLRSEPAPDQADYWSQANRDGGADDAERERPAVPGLAPPTAEKPASAAPAGASAAATIPAASPGTAPDSSPTTGGADAALRIARSAAQASDGPPGAALPVEPTQPLAPSHPAGDAIGSSAASIPPAHSEPAGFETLPHEPDVDFDATPALAASADPAGDIDADAGAETDATTSLSHEIAVLSAEIERKLRTYAARPRRKWISASTREHEFAVYLDAWRRRVEAVGNLNYPDEAERRGLSGNLLLEVALKPDGTIEEIALRRTSGEPVLDRAAIRIVELAAPFAPFPESIAAEVDILHVERTWIFHPGNRFSSP